MQVTFKIVSNHGGQLNKGNCTHLMQVTFKIYPLCLEINITIGLTSIFSKELIRKIGLKDNYLHRDVPNGIEKA